MWHQCARDEYAATVGGRSAVAGISTEGDIDGAGGALSSILGDPSLQHRGRWRRTSPCATTARSGWNGLSGPA